MNYSSTYANPMGRTSRGAFVGALIVLLLVVALYVFVAKAGRNGDWVLVTLLYPAFVLHARRLHDMGQTAWLLVIPYAAILAAFWMHLFSPDAPYQAQTNWAAHILGALFILWGLLGKGQAEANKFGAAA